MNQIFLSSLVVVATMLGAGMVLPQILRLHRTASTNGVSAAWIGVGIAMNAWWTAYAVGTGLWGLLPVALGGVLLYGVLAAQVLGINGGSALRQLLMGAVVLGAIPLPALILGGIEAAGIAVGLCYAVQFTPAVIESLRASDLRGLSFSTWIMALGEAAIWAVYGLAIADVALIIGGAGGTFASAIIVVQIVRVLRPRIVYTGLIEHTS